MVAVKVILAVSVGTELASQIIGCLVLRVLEVVAAVGRGLPDVEDGARDGLAREEVRYGAVHAHHAPVGHGVLDDGAAELAEGRVG